MQDGFESDGLSLDAFAKGEKVRGFDGDVERFAGAFRERTERAGEFLVDDAILCGMTINYGVDVDRDDATGLEERGFREAFAQHGTRRVGVQAERFIVAVAADEPRELVRAQFGFKQDDLLFPAVAEELAVEIFPAPFSRVIRS